MHQEPLKKKWESILDVYKYRRRASRTGTLLNKASSVFNKDNDQESTTQKVYTVLQDNKQEFTNTKLRQFLMYSDSSWKIFTTVTIVIAFFLDTCLYTFIKSPERPYWVIIPIICLNLIFTFDVATNITLKKSKKWRRTLNLVEMDTSRVIFDVLLAVPYSMLYLFNLSSNSGTDDKAFDFQMIAPVVAVLRLYRILEHFYNKSSQAGSNQWSTFLTQYLILFALSVHSWACIWYLFAYRNFDLYKIRQSWSISAIYLSTETTLEWYFVCCYWSIMFLTTNCLGDLYPVTTFERVMATLIILQGFILTTIVFVGSLTSQFITITMRRSKYVRQLKNIQNHLTLINMDADTTKRIIRYYEDLWYQKSGVFNPRLLKMLPTPLQMEICFDLNAVPLYSSLLFRKLPDAFLRRLSIVMAHRFYLPGDIIYDHNQNKTNMVCITNGVVELLSDEDDESPMISFTKGTCFGEISLVYNIPARCTVKAATYVECQILQKTMFIKLMITYPDLVDQIRKEIEDRIERIRKKRLQKKEDTALKLNIYISKDKKKSSIKCLKEKLRYLQGRTDVDTVTEENELDQNCLDLYIIADNVRKKTKLFTCINKSFPWLLEADCLLVRYWELYMLLVVFYVCVAYPYYIAFMWRTPTNFFHFAQIALTVSLKLNLLVTLSTAVKTKQRYIKDFWGILQYRINTTGFYMDLVAMIPAEYIFTIHSSSLYHELYKEHLFYIAKGIKLCLVWRISHFFEKLEAKLLINAIIVKVSKYCIYIFLICYWGGIVLYMQSCFVARCSQYSWFIRTYTWEIKSTVRKMSKVSNALISSIYFSTTLLLSVGYGDFTPGDHYDLAVVAFLSLFGVLFSGHAISEFSSVVTHYSRTKTAFLEMVITIDKFLMENNMHKAIKARIMAFYELQWQYNRGVNLSDESWLDTNIVPSELRKKVLHQARFKTLTSIYFFQVKDKAYIHTLTEAAKDIILPPGEIIFYGGTVTRDLYIIESGYCLVTSEKMRENKKERVIGPGNHLGLLVLLYGVPAVSTVITLTHCKLISISYSAYNSALSLFPDMREHDGLLTQAELKQIENLAKTLSEGACLKYYNRLASTPKVMITNFVQEFFNDSFINVLEEYKLQKQSYWKSYKQFNFMTNIVPYLLIPIVMKPNGLFLRTWTIFRVSVAFITSIIVPITIAMAPMGTSFNVIIIVLEVICYLDLYLKLHIAYYGPKNQLIYHPYLTAKYYLKRAFIADLLTCFPWYAVHKLFSSGHDEGHVFETFAEHFFHCIARMFSILQIYKIYVAFWADTINALKRVYFMSVLQFMFLSIFYLNLYTCILITLTCRYVHAKNPVEMVAIVGNLSLDGPFTDTQFYDGGVMICKRGSWIDRSQIVQNQKLTPMKVYLLASYWTATSFSGAGFGDVTPQDTIHIVLTVVILLHGVFFFGYVYARIASLKAMADQVTTKFLENLKQLELFMTREKMHSSLKKTIMEYWKYQWKRTGGWSHQKILGKLHANLNEDAVLYMYEKTLREIPLFENVENTFFRAFAKQLKERYFQKGYMVTRSNEVMTSMFIIYRGKVDVTTDTNEAQACMGPGGIFGNIRGEAKFLTLSNIVASRNIDLLSIDGVEFYALLKSYPTVHRKVMLSVSTTAKDYVLPTLMAGRMSLVLDTIPTTYEGEEYTDSEDSNAEYAMSPSVRSLDRIDSHGSRSFSLIFNAVHIPAFWLLFLPHRWFRSSVLPDCKWVIFMDYFILVLSYLEFMFIVYEMAFLSNEHLVFISIVTDTIFLYKVFLDVHTSYMNRYGDYILHPKKVRKVYFSKIYQRRRDLLVNLPVCYLALALDLQPDIKLAFFCYLRTPQLFRITYLITHRTHRQVNIGSANLFVKLTTIIIWASILTHMYACLFFKLSCLTPVQCTRNNWMTKPELHLGAKYNEGKFFSLYIASLWYVMNLITIAGMGDVSAQNDFELVETIIITITIKFCIGLLISEMSAMISAHSASLIAYDESINELRNGLKYMDLSNHQMNKMWDYVKELWTRQQGRQMPELVYKLPYRLRLQLMQAVYGNHIRDSVIFSKTEEDFKRMLCMWLSHCVFFPGNYIVQCGDSDQCLYFIHRGEVEVLTVHPNLTESIYDVLGPEDCFGIVQGLFVGVPHHFSFRARTVVDIVYLKLDQWKYLLDFYPKSAKIIHHKVENVYLAI